MSEQYLEQIVDELMQLGEEKFFKTLLMLNAITDKAKESNTTIFELRAQLGTAKKDRDAARNCYQHMQDRNKKLMNELASERKVLAEQFDREEKLEQERDNLQAELKFANIKIGKANVNAIWKEEFGEDWVPKKVVEKLDNLQAANGVLREALDGFINTINDQLGVAENETFYISEFGLHVSPELEPWCSIFTAKEKAEQALSTTPAAAGERVKKIIELLQDAINETKNGEKLSAGFVAAGEDALGERGGADGEHIPKNE